MQKKDGVALKCRSMKAIAELPEGYKEIYSVDMHTDKKMAFLVNFIAVIISVLLIVPVLFVVPISGLFSMEDGLISYWTRLISLIVLLFVYMVLHELVHGIAMKLCGTKKVKYGFKGMYAFASSSDYYGKKAYIFIALAPVILLGVILAVVNATVPTEWFWIIYFIQISNLSGAAGDLFVTVRFFRFPKDILVKDLGVSMCVYSKE